MEFIDYFFAAFMLAGVLLGLGSLGFVFYWQHRIEKDQNETNRWRMEKARPVETRPSTTMEFPTGYYHS